MPEEMFRGIGGHGDANSDSYHTMRFSVRKIKPDNAKY